LADRDVRLDYSAIAQGNATGTLDVLRGMMTLNLTEMVANTPSGSLLMGSNPRIADSYRSAARWMHLRDDRTNPTEFVEVVKAFCEISTGCSNAFKAYYMASVGRRISSSGAITEEHVGKIEAAGLLLGFPGFEAAHNYDVSKEAYEASSDMEKDYDNWYANLKRDLRREGYTAGELDWTQRILTEHFRGHDSITGRAYLDRLIARDIKNGDGTYFNGLMRLSGLPDRAKVREIYNKVADPRMRSLLLRTLDEVDAYYAKLDKERGLSDGSTSRSDLPTIEEFRNK